MTASTSGIKYYFSILFKMANRRIRDFGLNPVLGHILIVILFALLSEVIFYKSPLLAPYILSLGCFFWQLSLSQKDRSDFLLITFGDKAKIKIRIIENLLVFIPFAISISSWSPVLWLGLINTGLGCFFYFSSIGKLPAQSVAVCGYIEPLSAVLLSAIVLKERMMPLQFLGAALIIGGALYGELRDSSRT